MRGVGFEEVDVIIEEVDVIIEERGVWREERDVKFEKAQIVEKLKSELAAKLSSMALEINYSDNMDAIKIASKIVKKKVDTLDFFSFAELRISMRESKSMRNYVCMLNRVISHEPSRCIWAKFAICIVRLC